ncbi:hypothetical protein DPMN_025844 [Dreissena polymorpha]|uniref:Secreted protein n=1 Tax=Dreissena polymorpha TaxID=45954 RepID=A0A9D4LS41_DREPO|nr:hypothetical protein DPMN_025844 [Dreissena polymorpha]
MLLNVLFLRIIEMLFLDLPTEHGPDYYVCVQRIGCNTIQCQRHGSYGKQSLADLSVTVPLCIRTEGHYFGQSFRQCDVTDVTVKARPKRKQRPRGL